ncbi:hypothetical protein BGZ70_010299 [Mortierella alpina]|uniref:Pentatricopeptide repeat-containing protein n=1 Tax=Mortierella alpina TaxID=64518 RepID=A0A9P6LZS8_MORAP|nr:hypothetical protein BGZ70_010299 [Mortierella alpina]
MPTAETSQCRLSYNRQGVREPCKNQFRPFASIQQPSDLSPTLLCRKSLPASSLGSALSRRSQLALFSTSAQQSSSGSVATAESYPNPYAEPEVPNFKQCKNPTQLEKSITSYLKSHPTPSERALVAMLAACADLNRAATQSSPRKEDRLIAVSRKERGHRAGTSAGAPWNERDDRTASPRDLGPSLLQTILQSSLFTSDQVFRIACSIYENISGASNLASGGSGKSSHSHNPSLQVTNAFLHVCAVTGHFDRAWSVLQEMVQRPQGDVKPDLTTYRHVLKAAAVHRNRVKDRNEETEFNARVERVIEQGAEALSRQARMAFWMKLGLGVLVGATVGKFTTMGILALAESKILARGAGLIVQGDPLEATGSTTVQVSDGMIDLLACQEIAAGIGLAAGLLTVGYVIKGSTRQSCSATAVTATGESGSKGPSRHQYVPDSLPRARLFGLYFPDLTTIKKEEIRDFLRMEYGAFAREL